MNYVVFDLHPFQVTKASAFFFLFFLVKNWKIHVNVSMITLTRSSGRIFNPMPYTGYEWGKQTKFLLTFIYGWQTPHFCFSGSSSSNRKEVNPLHPIFPPSSVVFDFLPIWRTRAAEIGRRCLTSFLFDEQKLLK